MRENHSRSKTSTLRPKKGRLKSSTAEPGQESSGPQVETTIIVTENVLKEKSNNISTNSYKARPFIEDDVSPSKSDILLRQNGSVPDLCDVSLPSGGGEKSESEAAWLDWVENTRPPEDKTKRLKRRSFSNEDNLNASDLSILRTNLTTMSLKGSRDEIERVKDYSCDEGSNLPQPTKEWKDKDLGNQLKPDKAAKVEEVAGDQEGVQTTHSDAKAPDMDTLLSITEVTAVTQWLEEKQGSDLEKPLQPPLPILLPPPIVRVNKSAAGSCSDQPEVESTGAESEGDSCSAAWPPPPSPLRLRLRGWPEEEEERMQGNGSVAGSQILAVHSLGLKLGLDPPSDPEDAEEGHNNDNRPIVKLPKEQLKEEDCEEESSTGGPFEEVDMEICDPCYCYTKCWLDTFASFFCVSLL